MGVHGDGSCFFHSLAATINYEGYIQKPRPQRQAIGHRFRCEFQNRMSESVWNHIATTTPHNIKRSADEVQQDFCRPSVWAEETMIKYTAQHMELNIVFLDGDTGKFYCAVQGEPETQDTVVMAWVNRAHFEPIMFVDKVCKDHVHMHGRLRANNPQDQDTIIRPLHAAFHGVCETHELK